MKEHHALLCTLQAPRLFLCGKYTNITLISFVVIPATLILTVSDDNYLKVRAGISQGVLPLSSTIDLFKYPKMLVMTVKNIYLPKFKTRTFYS